MQILRIKPIQVQVLEFLYRSSRSAILEEFLRQGARIYVLGGAVRDVIASDLGQQSDRVPRDFDIAVSGIQTQEFEYLLSAFGSKNRHGGFVLQELGKPAWDVWRLEDSIGLRKTGAAFSLENVLRTFSLDCNAVALDIRSGFLTDAGAIRAIHLNQLGFVANTIEHSVETFAAKALLMQLRFGYSISKDIEDSIGRHLNLQTLRYESRKVFPQIALLDVPFWNSALRFPQPSDVHATLTETSEKSHTDCVAKKRLEDHPNSLGLKILPLSD